MSDQVQCQFKHIPSKRDGEQLAINIELFVQPKVFHKKGIQNCGEGGNDTIQFSLARDVANRIRDKFTQVLPNESSPIWFHILSDPLNGLDQRSLQTTDDPRHQGSMFSVSCQFGSLRSHNLFYSHVPFDNRMVNVTFRPARQLPDSLTIEFDNIRLVIPFSSIQKKNILVNKENEKSGIFILIPLKHVPYIYRLEPIKSDDKKNHNANMKPVRLCADERNVEFLNDIAKCSDLVFHFQQSRNMAWAFLNYFLAERPYRYEINFSNFQILDWSKENNKKQKPDPFDYDHASYQDRYALQMLISLGFVFRDKWAQLTDQELNWNRWNANDRYRLCCFAAEQLCKDHGYDLRRTERDYNETRRKTEDSDKDKDEKALLAQNTQLLKVAVCTLTPLRIVFQPLEVTTGSRALRNDQFGGAERFLLVHFREEDNDRLRATNTNIKYRLRQAMRQGIDLFGRKFKYMGASTGQMKEMAFWFIDLPPKMKSIMDAHRLLGKFDDITNIATYIARVGQYFSRTWPVGIKLTEVESVNDIRRNSGVKYVARIPDIERGEYCFTDGIGKISLGLAGRIAQRMNLPLSSKKDIPSAYQVRVAGCKGMVAIDPNSTLDDYYILVRKSMMKFESDDWNLEICDYARPITLTLNNQVIRLLNDLGNHDNMFITLQKQGFTQWEIPEDQQPRSIEIAVQKNLSYSTSKDNLLTNRIPIPPTDGRNMFGVADETGELKYGECFIQYSSFSSTNNTQTKVQVVIGDIIVTKNPCLWPGDFRRLKAVRNKKLEECMRDVIVFPINGERPHSNEISGSDLDGDQYWVYWGEHFKIQKNAEPLSYKGAKKLEEPSIEEEKIINHIVESFSAGVILGMIANTHTVAADKDEKHSYSDDCKQLAELFALAVDSPKTGQFIQKEQIRPFQARYCKDWPKFMRKFGEPQSNSTSVLEKLYDRAVEVYQRSNEETNFNKFIQKKKGGLVNKIDDKVFEKWLREIDEEIPTTTTTEPKPRKSKAAKSNDDDDDEAGADKELTPPSKPKKSTTDGNSSKETGKPSKRSETPLKESKKLAEKSSEEESVTPKLKTNKKESSDTKKSDELINSNPTASGASSLASLAASGASSLASLAASNGDQCYLDFQIISGLTLKTTSVVEFPEASGGLYTIKPKNEITGGADQEVIQSRLVSYLEKQDVFKRNSPAANEALYGSLCLMIFYGHIHFSQSNLPQKLGELQTLVIDKGDQIIRFNYADIKQLTIRGGSSSTTKKKHIDYELDCCLSSSASEYITLLFDKNKALRQIRVYRTWLRSYIRLPNYPIDNLYEIRSVITHDLGSSEFERISNSVFKTESKDLLTDRKPYIKIDRNLLFPSVVLISLKIIDEDTPTAIDELTGEAFYRTVKHVSINEQKDKPKASLEYHIIPINKNKDILKEVCNFALSPLDA